MDNFSFASFNNLFIRQVDKFEILFTDDIEFLLPSKDGKMLLIGSETYAEIWDLQQNCLQEKISIPKGYTFFNWQAALSGNTIFHFLFARNPNITLRDGQGNILNKDENSLFLSSNHYLSNNYLLFNSGYRPTAGIILPSINKVISTDYNQNIYLFDIESMINSKDYKWVGGSKTIFGMKRAYDILSYTSNERYLFISCDGERKIGQIWQLYNEINLAMVAELVLNKKGDSIVKAEFSESGKFLALVLLGYSSQMRLGMHIAIYNSSNLSVIKEIYINEIDVGDQIIQDVKFLHNDSHLLVALANGMLLFFDLDNWMQIGNIQAHDNLYNVSAESPYAQSSSLSKMISLPDKRHYATAGFDALSRNTIKRAVKIWEISRS